MKKLILSISFLALSAMAFAGSDVERANGVRYSSDLGTVAPKLNGVIYVDGVKYPRTSAGINSAFTDCQASSCGTVYATAGNYTVSSTIVVPAASAYTNIGYKLQLDEKAVLVPTSDINVVQLKNKARIEGGSIKADGVASWTKALIYIDGNDHVSYGTGASNIFLYGQQTGLNRPDGIFLDAHDASSYAFFSMFNNITMIGIDHGIFLSAPSGSSGNWVNGNMFNDISITDAIYPIYVDGDNTTTNEAAGNSFENIQIQSGDDSVSLVYCTGTKNRFSFMPWDLTGTTKIAEFTSSSGYNTIDSRGQYYKIFHRSRYVDSGTRNNFIDSGVTPSSGVFYGSPQKPMTGSIDATASTTVVGVGTKFLSEVNVGDKISVQGVVKTVTAIASDTSLTVHSAYTDLPDDPAPIVIPSSMIVKGSDGVSRFVIDPTTGFLTLGTVSSAINSNALTINYTGSTGVTATDATSAAVGTSVFRGIAKITTADVFKGQTLGGSSSAPLLSSGNVGYFTADATGSTATSYSMAGSVLRADRPFAYNKSGNTLTVTGPVANFVDNMTQTAGTITHTANVLNVEQDYASSTGTVLNVKGLGTGNLIDVVDNTTTVFTVKDGGNVGVGTTNPNVKLEVNGDTEILSTGAFYIGDKATDGSWRFIRSGNNLVIERRESGSWVTKSTVSA